MNAQTRNLHIDGPFDAAAAARMRPLFEEIATAADADVVIDLSAVGFIDSSGIGAIVFLYKRLATAGRTLGLAGVQGQPLQLMEFLRIPRVIPLHPTTRAA